MDAVILGKIVVGAARVVRASSFRWSSAQYRKCGSVPETAGRGTEREPAGNDAVLEMVGNSITVGSF